MTSDAELERLRHCIDAVNLRLVALLQERARLVQAIGAHKRGRGLPLLDEPREAAMRRAVERAAEELGGRHGFEPAALQRIFAQVLHESRRLLDAPKRR